jgi:predicted secreted protein
MAEPNEKNLESQFGKLKNTYEEALSTLLRVSISSRSTPAVARHTVEKSIDQILLDLADMKVALVTLIQVYARRQYDLRRRSEKLLKDVEEAEQQARNAKALCFNEVT